MSEVTIAITAIPNSGKTTLFNRLTGANQRVGNWPGVSVEKKIGRLRLDGFHVQLVDLPGAYSITPSSLEEEIVRNYFLDSPPHLILNVVEAGNLYRGLGMTLQLSTSGSPESFIMELPPYRLPLLRTVGLRSWQEVKDFLYRATTLIIAGVILVWFLTHYPGNLPAGSAETLAGRMGRSLAPLFEPIGIH
jgi:Fe2+ transport system protein B